MSNETKAAIFVYGGLIILLVFVITGIWYVTTGMKQAALERQGIHMSRWDITVLDPKVRVMPNGKTEVITD